MKAQRSLLAASLAAASALGTALLLHLPPALSSVYPHCPIHEYLHLQCPGCGATRAVAALLHGRLMEALHLNALFVASLPFVLAYAGLSCYRAATAEEFRWPEPPRWTIQAALATAFVFTLIRNLPHG